MSMSDTVIDPAQVGGGHLMEISKRSFRYFCVGAMLCFALIEFAHLPLDAAGASVASSAAGVFVALLAKKIAFLT
ncbi:MAG TPA: hypothetical protein VGB91_02650 [Rhizomicrobium sp.]